MSKKYPTRKQIEKRERISKIVVIFVLLFIISAVSFYISKISPKQQEMPEETEVEVVSSSPMPMTSTIDNEITDKINADTLYIKPYIEENSDTIGYIEIADTQVDYPVLYSGDNDFYMDKNFEKQQAKEGAIFMDFRCDYKDFSKTRNIILYGHRMKDGSMFKELTSYLDKDFYKSHGIFRFDTIDEAYEWEVFAVFETNIDFYYIDTTFTDDEWLKFMRKCYGLSLYKDEDIKFYPTDIILTLSTCAIKKDKRFVVMARLK